MDYLSLVKNNGMSLKEIPLEKITEEICRTAIQNNNTSFRYVPDTFKTEELCSFAVSISGTTLKFVPESLKTDTLCRTAIQNFPWALKEVPEELKTKELCEFAFEGCMKTIESSNLIKENKINDHGKQLLQLLLKATPEPLLPFFREKYEC